MKKAFIAAMTVVAIVAMGCASGSKTAQTPEEAAAAAAKAAEIQGLFELVDVAGGSFKMGDSMGEKDEFPVHTVDVGSFKMASTEVTQELYKKVMGSNPSYFRGEKLPVEKVSWLDAVKFCNKLSEIQGLDPCYTIGSSVSCDFNANGYRLSTEAEWEYAARGGKANEKFQYAGSDSIDEVAWYTGNSNNETHEVGTKAPNSLGLYDMSG
ncbi:MAG: formylglycine-generating enzyme family protein, partial [Treponema sp.]|nr:formylglycine-generating enzyme family protein [Treponema sp.]